MSKIKLSKINIDGGTQPREDIDEGIVSEYADAMQDGDEFPPIVVFNDGAKYWLADGFHRYHACKKIGYLEIDVEVKTGTKRDAILYSVSANAKHGLRRTNADKRKAVKTLLQFEDWQTKSTRQIADKCCVSNFLVSEIKKQVLDSNTLSKPVTGKDGKEYTVDTSNIGKSKQVVDFEDDSFEDDWGEDDFEDEEIEKTPPGQVRPERKGIGLQKAHKAIAKLKEIPEDDGLIEDAYDTVIQWINHNR